MHLKKLFACSIALFGLALFSGCQREMTPPDSAPDTDLHKVVFHASWAPETKTVLQEDGSVWWEPGDSIKLFALINPVEDATGATITGHLYTFVSTNTERASETEFVGNVDSDFDNALAYVALYPYSSNSSAALTQVWCDVPSVQTAVAGGFDPSAFVSFAVADADNNLFFKNLCGGIKFTVSQDGIKEVSFRNSDSNGDMMSGGISAQYDGSDITQTWVGSGPSEVIVRAPDDSYFEVGKYYYAVMKPIDNNAPIIVTYKKDSSKASYWTSGPTLIKCSVFKKLYNKDAGLSFTPFKNEAFLKQSLPDSMQGSDIVNELTEAHFHPSSDHITGVNLGTEEAPVYFELIGTAVHYYTPKESFNLKNLHGLNPMFCGWSSLAEVDLTGVDVSEVTDFSRFFERTSLKYIDLSNFDTSSAVYMNSMFQGCKNLESLDLTSFNTEHVTNMYQMFAECGSLKELDLSSFNTSSCVNMGGMFNTCRSLQKLDLANFNVSSVKDASYMCDLLATHRKHCVIRTNEATKELMCSYEAMMPLASLKYYIKWIAPEEAFPTIEDPFADLYKSTDYSRDKSFTQVQTATKGRGLDIVIMGDAYSDRLINDGTYYNDLNNAIEQIFSEEPLKSLRDYFNVYIVYAVSENETHTGINVFDVAFESWASSMTMDGPTIDDYIKVALPNHLQFGNDRPDPYTIIIQNAHTHDGVCRFWACGGDVVVSALGEDDTDFHYIICHEFGHSIGRLADEYYGGATFSSDQSFINRCSEGWWPNVDITSDPNSVKWSRFLQDGRYANQGLGVFEGGFADYAYGIWRPTENSLMNNASTGFNAPCREAIYKRVNELADDSFAYDYEAFVAFDRPSWDENTTSNSNSVARLNIGRTMRPLPPPVFIKGAKNPNGASTTIHN